MVIRDSIARLPWSRVHSRFLYYFSNEPNLSFKCNVRKKEAFILFLYLLFLSWKKSHTDGHVFSSGTSKDCFVPCGLVVVINPYACWLKKVILLEFENKNSQLFAFSQCQINGVTCQRLAFMHKVHSEGF